MPEPPANRLIFEGYDGLEIHQWHDTAEPPPHDHLPSEVTGDGWISFVVRTDSGEKRGPFALGGQATAELRKWFKELAGGIKATTSPAVEEIQQGQLAPDKDE